MTALDLRVPFAVCQEAFGLPATVTRPAPNDTPVTTTVVWLTPGDQAQPFGTDLSKRDPRKHLAVARSATIPALPRGTLIAAAELDGTETKTWRVDGYVQPMTVDEMRVLVIEV